MAGQSEGHIDNIRQFRRSDSRSRNVPEKEGAWPVPAQDKQTSGEGCDLTATSPLGLVENAYPSPLPTGPCRP